MERKRNECIVCNKTFTEKSNLTRHMKLHAPKEIYCDECGKSFSFTQQLYTHLKQHQLPSIPMYRQGEAKLQCTDLAKTVAKAPSQTVDPRWLDPKEAEAAAKTSGGGNVERPVSCHIRQVCWTVI